MSYTFISKTCKASAVLQVSFVLFIFFSPFWSHAQSYPTGNGSTGSYPNATSPNFQGEKDSVTQEIETELDTAQYSYFFQDNPGRFYTDKDSLLGDNFHQYDPARQRSLDYFNLGRVNSAAYPSVYQPAVRRGLDMGLHAYDLYYLKNNDIRFYQQGKALTDAFFSGTQQNSLIKLKFSRNFANNINFSLDYLRSSNINQLNSQGPTFNRSYKDSIVRSYLYEGFPRGRITTLGVGFWVNRSRYDGYLTYTFNLSEQLDKGGIADDSLFRISSYTYSLPEILTDAQTRHQRQEIAYLHYLKLNKKDSTGNKRAYLASHRISYKSDLYKSYDPFSSSPSKTDSTFYGSLLNDARGLRFYLKENQIENSFNISTTKNRSSDSTHKGGSMGQKDWFEVGIAHSFHRLNQEAFTQNINNVIVKGRWNFTPNENIKVETYAHFNILGYNIGDYRLNGEAFLNIKNIGSLTLKASNSLYAPSYLQTHAYLTQRELWNNDFKKTLETHLSGTLSIPKAHFEGTVAYSLLNNYIYFDKTFRPQQTSTPLSILQLILVENLQLGSFHLDNTIAFQKSTEKFVRLPDIYTKHSLYAEGKIFKKAMLARAGFDIRYASAWFAPAYMPLMGQFYIQEKGSVNAYPSIDVFLSFKVKTFRFFAKMENLIGSFSDNVYYQIYNSPVPDRQFRFGVRWNLLN